MLKHPDYTTQLTDVSRELSHRARDAWHQRSKEERGGIYIALVVLLVAGLIGLIWQAGQKTSVRSTELPIDEDNGR